MSEELCPVCRNRAPLPDLGLCVNCLSRWQPRFDEALLTMLYAHSPWRQPAQFQLQQEQIVLRGQRRWDGCYVTFIVAPYHDTGLGPPTPWVPWTFTRANGEIEEIRPEINPLMAIQVWKPGVSGYLYGYHDEGEPIPSQREQWRVGLRTDEPRWKPGREGSEREDIETIQRAWLPALKPRYRAGRPRGARTRRADGSQEPSATALRQMALDCLLSKSSEIGMSAQAIVDKLGWSNSLLTRRDNRIREI